MTAPAIAVRTSAVILDGDELCLIHRRRPAGDQYSVPGGLVQNLEPIPAALARELREELDLDLAEVPQAPELRWVQDQITNRPGTTTPLRRLHLVHLVRLPSDVRPTIATTEKDAEDDTAVTWVDYREAAGLHLYPDIRPALRALPGSSHAPGPVWLEPMTDHTYQWR
ncbi:NUDIX hydrolase [Streptomyces sp. SPB4]|uniref:NUDIX hydrolase n=1 Tax=Streptomyces sp. SPB4 TaxID=2940553 RepID=UPI002475E57C|nr:NUDIX hydrolase [Streptomyces sp. SPB4]MDH6545097.1 ADP-ribose pyrophosphatase YjhB (NUDIX family) [Streptomyces sp. SPB4]